MKRGLRMSLVAALCLGVGGMYALHPHCMALAWQVLLERKQLTYGLLLLSQATIVYGCLYFLIGELAAYWRWKVGRPGPQDAEREASWAVALHRFGTPARLVGAMGEAAREAWHDRRRTYARAQRRWPRKKRELAGWLARDWNRKIWQGVALVVGGEVLMSYLSYRIPGYTLTPVLSLGAALVGMAIGNALMFVGWVAGDDDEGGHRTPPPVPQTPRGHKRPKRARLSARLSLRVQRPNKQLVPQVWDGK